MKPPLEAPSPRTLPPPAWLAAYSRKHGTTVRRSGSGEFGHLTPKSRLIRLDRADREATP